MTHDNEILQFITLALINVFLLLFIQTMSFIIIIKQ